MTVNHGLQRRVLFREFLFRIVDRELLSSHSKGDTSQLLLQILTLLVCLSTLFCVPALFIGPGPDGPARLMFEWSAEHFLIATTMLTVGIFAVLGWGSMFPDHRDIVVLAPLPVRAHTILLAKIAALGAALAATVVSLHVATGIVWPLKLNASAPPYTIPALEPLPALPPINASGLEAALDRDLAGVLKDGALARGAGGVVIGVSTQGTRRVLAYGAAEPDSVFPIASVTKVFTGLALAHMIEEGVVRDEEPVRGLIPDVGATRASPGSDEITLRDLVTHTSGLPRMPVGFRPGDPGNPFADFSVQRLYLFLSARGFARPSDAGFGYSNVGFGLLAHALATRAGVEYATLVRQRITVPLAMRDTTIALTPDQQRRLMQGHDERHRLVEPWNIGGGLEGAGALRSTASDLLTWLEANLHPDRLAPGTLRQAIASSHRRLSNAGEGGVAFGWFVTPAGDYVHSGDIGGFSAQVWFNPSQDRALVVLSNTERGSSISADVISEHIRARLDGLPAIAIADTTVPERGGVRGWVRMVVAYWLTMAAAGLFVFSVTVGLQSLAAAILPHRYFLRVSSALQLGVFCTLVATYFLQPMVVTPTSLYEAQRESFFESAPSYWFLGLFQALSGSPALAPLAERAVIGLLAVVIASACLCAVSYLRTLRRMAEAPDLSPAIQVARRLPLAGSAHATAIVHFSARTLFRSAPHRVIYLFYLGIGFALSAVFLKTPRAQELAGDPGLGSWDQASMPLIVSSVVMMVCAVVGARLTFAMPRDLPANWIFRVMPVRGGSRYLSARRCVFFLLAAGPVWLLSAAVFLSTWPWLPAVGHLLVLGLLAAILVEQCLTGTQRIPFTCSYLPGQSRSHVFAPMAIVLLLILAIFVADFERRALQDGVRYAATVGVLGVVWIAARWRTSLEATTAAPAFEDEPADRMLTLEVWDSRIDAAPPASSRIT
jgi:CubicO group peptidase (beta-lactamase class C family)